ncbi:MAG: hypothetical protein OQK24_02580 [Magnetovibrio sp.]|nr:hypothetical protein [Magnetovibrio sp.]
MIDDSDLKKSSAAIFVGRNTVDSFLDSVLLPKGGKRALIFATPAAAGSSFYLFEKVKAYSHLGIAIFIDQSHMKYKSFYSQLVSYIIDSHDLKKRLDKYILRNFDKKQLDNVWRSLIRVFPYIGTAVSNLKSVDLELIDTQLDEDRLVDLLISFLAEDTPDEDLVLFIDDLPLESGEFLHFIDVLGFKRPRNFKIVLSTKDTEGSFIYQIDNLLSDLEFSVTCQKYPEINPDFIADFLSTYGVEFNGLNTIQNDIENFKNIHRLKNLGMRLKDAQSIGALALSHLVFTPTEIEKKIIGYLSVTQEPLWEVHIHELLARSETIFIENEMCISSALDNLEQANVLSVHEWQNGENYIELRIATEKYDVVKSDNRLDYLVLAKELYDFFSPSVSPGMKNGQISNFTGLLFRLSLIVDRDRADFYGRNLLAKALKFSDFQKGKEILDQLKEKNLSSPYEDFLLQSIFLVSSKKYEQVITAISTSAFKTEPLQILMGICQNRLRLHQAAEISLSRASLQNASDEEKVIVSCYRIANFIHWVKLKDAQETFEKSQLDLSSSSMYGYLLRNGAPSLPLEQKKMMEERAFNWFEHNRPDDLFGLYSTQVNWGSSFIGLGDYEEAARITEEAQNGMRSLGLRHNVIVSFNQAVLHLLRGNFKESRTLFDRVSGMPDHNIGMTKHYILMYRAYLDYFCGQQNGSEEKLYQLLDNLRVERLSRPKERCYSNAALLAHALSWKDQKLLNIVKIADDHPDTRDPERTAFTMAFIKRQIDSGIPCPATDDVLHHISPSYFAYWYMDDIQLLSRRWLAPQSGDYKMVN